MLSDDAQGDYHRGGPADWHHDAVALLVTQAKQGDRRAFAELYQSRLDGVGRYVGAIVRDPILAEDIVAQAFMLAWRDLPKLREHRRFDAWLYKIAHNHAISELRRPTATAIENAPDFPDLDRTVSPELSLDALHNAITVREALIELPDAQREVLQLRFFQDLSSAEVARQLGKTDQAIHALQYRAIANLREIIDQDAIFTIGSWVAADSRRMDRPAA